MLQQYLMQQEEIILGWGFFLPLIAMVVLILLAVRIWVVIGVGSFAMLLITGVLPPTLLGEALFDGIDSFALIAVPLFILTGDILVRTGLSGKLLDVAEATMGSTRSGLGTSTVLGCGFFACISGSDAADAAAIGRITIDRLAAKGYPKPYACALVAAGACTGILIPPSISYIIIGLVLGISASTLFLAAAIPGVLILLSIMFSNAVVNRMKGYENSTTGFNFQYWRKTVYAGRFALLIPFIILGGIYSGIFTPTESAAVAALTAIIIGFFQRTLKLGDIPKILRNVRQSERCDRAHHRHEPAPGPDPGQPAGSSGVREFHDLSDEQPLLDHYHHGRHFDDCRLRHGNDAEYRHPGALAAAAGPGNRYERSSFLYIYDHLLGYWFYYPTHGLELVRGFRRHRGTDRIHLQIRLSVCFLHARHRAVDRLRAMDFTLVD